MHVLMVTPEVGPYAQTGGLGEVLSALPAELVDLGVDVEVFMPKYRGIDTENYSDLKKTELTVTVDLNAKKITAGVWERRNKRGVKHLFLECDDYFDRRYLYGTPAGDYEDNSERFVFLTRAALEIALARKKRYDVFHSHDWQAALTPVYLRYSLRGGAVVRR